MQAVTINNQQTKGGRRRNVWRIPPHPTERRMGYPAQKRMNKEGMVNFEVRINAENEDESCLLPYAVASMVATVANANGVPFSRLLEDVGKAYMDLVNTGDGGPKIVENGAKPEINSEPAEE